MTPAAVKNYRKELITEPSASFPIVKRGPISGNWTIIRE